MTEVPPALPVRQPVEDMRVQLNIIHLCPAITYSTSATSFIGTGGINGATLHCFLYCILVGSPANWHWHFRAFFAYCLSLVSNPRYILLLALSTVLLQLLYRFL